MVENLDFPFKSGDPNDGAIGLASPKDRLAAYIVDVLLLLPLVQLLQSPFKRWILESFVFGESESVLWFRLINTAIFVFVFVMYYTTMTFWFQGQTLGKKFFSIKVISYQGKISFVSAFLRSISILFEMICVGLPFAALFSHSLRRPIHDRVADTLVISLKSPVSFPSTKEKWKAHAAAIALGAMAFATVFVYAIVMMSSDSSTLLSEYKQSCSKTIGGTDESLNSGIELFMAQKISGHCLFKHSREFLWDGEDVDLAHLAMALSFVDNPGKSDQYLEEVCLVNGDGLPCTFSQWVRNDLPLDKEEPFIKEVQSDENIANFYKVYAASAYQDNSQHQEVINLVKKINGNSQLQAYVSLLSFQSLLAQDHWDQAFWIYQTSEYVDHKQVISYINSVRKSKELTAQKQIELLESFYPSLNESSSQDRGIASQGSVHEDVLAVYALIKEAL